MVGRSQLGYLMFRNILVPFEFTSFLTIPSLPTISVSLHTGVCSGWSYLLVHTCNPDTWEVETGGSKV